MTSRDSFGGPKQQVSFNLSARLLSFLRQKAEQAGVTLNETVRDSLNDYFVWYGLPEGVVDVLRDDSKKQGKASQREYVIDLLMKRYADIIVQERSGERKK